MLDFSVIVVTHNRAELLRSTLAALAQLSYAGGWEVLVVDNGSSDGTRDVVAEASKNFPVELRYLHEPTLGKYGALNTGILAARGTFIAATDDDAYPQLDWLERAAAGLQRFGCGFVGGPVYPVWRGTPPRWVDPKSATSGKVLGLQYRGESLLEYGSDGVSWPLGVNVAYRREVFDRVGLFEPRLGRIAGTLRNQSQREWHVRARAAGVRGMYLPDMVVHHTVEAERLTRRYFHRWFYWHGISCAILYQTQGLHLFDPEGTPRHGHERHLLGVPLCVWRRAARACASAVKRWLIGKPDEAVRYELIVCYCAGVVRQCWKERGTMQSREALAG